MTKKRKSVVMTGAFRDLKEVTLWQEVWWGGGGLPCCNSSIAATWLFWFLVLKTNKRPMYWKSLVPQDAQPQTEGKWNVCSRHLNLLIPSQRGFATDKLQLHFKRECTVEQGVYRFFFPIRKKVKLQFWKAMMVYDLDWCMPQTPLSRSY